MDFGSTITMSVYSRHFKYHNMIKFYDFDVEKFLVKKTKTNFLTCGKIEESIFHIE
jgi:hypothetical protein